MVTVRTPTNSHNDRVYVNVDVRRDVPVAQLLKDCKHIFFAKHGVRRSFPLRKLGKRHWCLFSLYEVKVNSSY